MTSPLEFMRYLTDAEENRIALIRIAAEIYRRMQMLEHPEQRKSSGLSYVSATVRNEAFTNITLAHFPVVSQSANALDLSMVGDGRLNDKTFRTTLRYTVSPRPRAGVGMKLPSQNFYVDVEAKVLAISAVADAMFSVKVFGANPIEDRATSIPGIVCRILTAKAAQWNAGAKAPTPQKGSKTPVIGSGKECLDG